MSSILNWAHIHSIQKGEGDTVAVFWHEGETNSPAVPASNIEVVGEGSLRVNAWLKQVAGSSEEGASE
mgnify:FL=1